MVKNSTDCDKAQAYISKIKIQSTMNASSSHSISYKCINYDMDDSDYQQERKRLKTETGYIAVY